MLQAGRVPAAAVGSTIVVGKGGLFGIRRRGEQLLASLIVERDQTRDGISPRLQGTCITITANGERSKPRAIINQVIQRSPKEASKVHWIPVARHRLLLAIRI